MSDLTPEQQAVIDAAVAWEKHRHKPTTVSGMGTSASLDAAVRALLSTPDYRGNNDG